MQLLITWNISSTWFFAQSATSIGMYPNIFMTLTYQVFSYYFLSLNKSGIFFQNEMSYICYRSSVCFSVDVLLAIEIYFCLHISAVASANTECSSALVMTWDNFNLLLSMLSCSNPQFQIYLTTLFLPSLFCVAHVQQSILNNDFYGYY